MMMMMTGGRVEPCYLLSGEDEFALAVIAL